MRELIAPDGYVYALKSDNMIYGKRIYLGTNDSDENWELIEEKIIEKDEYNID